MQMVKNVHYFESMKDAEVYLRAYGNAESRVAAAAAAEESNGGRKRRSQVVSAPTPQEPSATSKKRLKVDPAEAQQKSKDAKKSKPLTNDKEEIVSDPFPALSNEGPEGELKTELVANSGKYQSEVMRPYLKAWGWDLQKKCDPSLFFTDYIILAPWARENFDKYGRDNILGLLDGADYFRDMSYVRDYILTHGNREPTQETKEAMCGRPSRRRGSIQPTTTAATVPVKARPKASKVSDKVSSMKKRASHQKEANLILEVEENAEEDEEEVGFSYTQFIAEHKSEKCTERKEPLPTVDDDCSTEIREIVRRICQDRPRLNPVKWTDVWSALRAYEWQYFYTTKLGAAEVYHRPRLDISRTNMYENCFVEGVHYFLSQEAVLAFVREQIEARGGDYSALADKALFYPTDDMDNDDSLLLNVVADEDHISLKLPTGSLYRSSNPYESHFDALTTHDCYEVEDDIPPFDMYGGADNDDSFAVDEPEEEEQEQVQGQAEWVHMGNEAEQGEEEEETYLLADSLMTQNETQTQAQCGRDVDLGDMLLSQDPVQRSQSDPALLRRPPIPLSPSKARKATSVVAGLSISHSKARPASVGGEDSIDEGMCEESKVGRQRRTEAFHSLPAAGLGLH